ncbi:MAG: sialate O-acetylesterase [Leadbetterella sp.]
MKSLATVFRSLFLLFALISASKLEAKVMLPGIFGSHMVLQQNAQVKIWGWAKPPEKVTITTSWDNASESIVTPGSGKWELIVETPSYGGPYTIKIEGKNNTILLEDVMIGEVWLASGQSNMEWSANTGITDGENEAKNANFEKIRFFSVGQVPGDTPQQTCEGEWAKCTPQSMKSFSAVAYFFAKRIHETLDIPIGVVNASWGGTTAEAWTPSEFIEADPVLKSNSNQQKNDKWGPRKPGQLYNGMIAPLVGFAFKGVIWYQGESNVDFAYHYDRLLGTLIRSWRQKWGQPMPFLLVQIAPFKYETPEVGVAVRNAQRRVENKVENTGVVVISDIGDPGDIHPKNKKDVGFRLGNMALRNYYNTNLGVISGPKLLTYENTKGQITLIFDTVDLLCDEKCKNSFEIADISGNFVKADVRVRSNSIILTSKESTFPIFARFEWLNGAEATLKNSKGYPASAFVTDNWLEFKGF